MDISAFPVDFKIFIEYNKYWYFGFMPDNMGLLPDQSKGSIAHRPP